MLRNVHNEFSVVGAVQTREQTEVGTLVMAVRVNVREEPETLIPEPVELYGLVVVTLITHAPHPDSSVCVQCHLEWPCAPARLAYRLREAF